MADKALGIRLIASTPDISDEEKELLLARKAARDNKDYDKSDELRDQLEEAGIKVIDGPNGQIWQY